MKYVVGVFDADHTVCTRKQERTCRMNRKSEQILATALLFLGLLVLGVVVVQAIPFNYLEAGILYLAGVIGAGLYWVGRDR